MTQVDDILAAAAVVPRKTRIEKWIEEALTYAIQRATRFLEDESIGLTQELRTKFGNARVTRREMSVESGGGAVQSPPLMDSPWSPTSRITPAVGLSD